MSSETLKARLPKVLNKFGQTDARYVWEVRKSGDDDGYLVVALHWAGSSLEQYKDAGELELRMVTVPDNGEVLEDRLVKAAHLIAERYAMTRQVVGKYYL